jgi:hypothetical protein
LLSDIALAETEQWYKCNKKRWSTDTDTKTVDLPALAKDQVLNPTAARTKHKKGQTMRCIVICTGAAIHRPDAESHVSRYGLPCPALPFSPKKRQTI